MPEEDLQDAVFDPRSEAGRFVMKRKTEWETSMRQWRQARARLDKRYYNFREDFTSTGEKATATPRANIGVPLAAETVDTALARAYDSFFRSQPYGKVWGREETDQMNAESVQMVMDYQQQCCNLPLESQRIFKDAFKYGLGIGKLQFKKELKRFPTQWTPADYMAASLQGIELPAYEDRVVFESPILKHVHIQDAFFQRDATDVDTADGIVHRTWESAVQLRTATDGLGLPLYNTSSLPDFPKAGKSDDPELTKEYTTRLITEGGLKKENKFEVLEYTGKLPMNLAQNLMQEYPGGSIDGDWIVTIVAGVEQPLRVEPCPYLTNRRMFLFCRVIEDPGYLTGISIIEFVERLGLTIDELYNIVLDNMNFVINKQYYVNELAGVDEADVVSSPGKVIRGKRPFTEAMGVIQTPDISQSVFIVLNQLLGHYKEYTGITQTVLGGTSPGRETATEIAAIVRNSSTRLGQFERMIEDTFMRPLFERWTVLNQQFLTQEFVVRVFKDSRPLYPKVAPEDIQGAFDFKFEGATRAESIALLTGQIMQMLQINATQPVPIFDPVYLGKKLADSWGWTDSERAMNPAFAEQFMLFQQLAALRNIGETAKALTPEQQAQAKTSGGSNKAKQGNAAQPQNTSSKDFQGALATIKENALPASPGES